jgi:hypothetical protein
MESQTVVKHRECHDQPIGTSTNNGRVFLWLIFGPLALVGQSCKSY